MTILTKIPRSIKPSSTAVILGVGNSGDLFALPSGTNGLEFRFNGPGASGATRGIYARLKLSGAGEGEAVRAYAETGALLVATGGSVHGLHASLAMIAASSISGQGFASRHTIDAAADTRTISGNVGAILAESNFAAGNTIPATVALIHLKEIGAVTCTKAFRFPAVAVNGMVAAHITDAMTHSIRCVTDAGTVLHLMATTIVSNRTNS